MTEAEIVAEHVHNAKVLILNELKNNTSFHEKDLSKAEKILRYALNALAVMVVRDVKDVFPSDEQISEMTDGMHTTIAKEKFIAGAKWVRDQMTINHKARWADACKAQMEHFLKHLKENVLPGYAENISSDPDLSHDARIAAVAALDSLIEGYRLLPPQLAPYPFADSDKVFKDDGTVKRSYSAFVFDTSGIKVEDMLTRYPIPKPVVNRTAGPGEIEVWMEGFAVTGQHGTAHQLGVFRADTFDEAVEIYNRTRDQGATEATRDFPLSNWKIWGCRLFDNEADARKSFG